MDSRFPIEPGRQQLTVTVTVEWALGPSPKHAQPTTNQRSVRGPASDIAGATGGAGQ
jgi:hypothetical protein